MNKTQNGVYEHLQSQTGQPQQLKMYLIHPYKYHRYTSEARAVSQLVESTKKSL